MPFKCSCMLICILFCMCGLHLFSKWWLYMHVQFHQSLTTFLIAKTTTLRKILKACRNGLVQYEFCKLYSMTNWLFRMVPLANLSISHGAIVLRAPWHPHPSQYTRILLWKQGFPGKHSIPWCGGWGGRGWAVPPLLLQHGSLCHHGGSSLICPTSLTQVCFPCVTSSTSNCPSASPFSKSEGVCS